MGRKRRFSKLLLFAAMVSTIGAGVLGSIPLQEKAAEEEETYTVRFEAYEGTCETESVTVPKGESIILPDATYEGHYLMNWIDAVKSENMTTFLSVGSAGWEYTPERDLWLYANWKPNQETYSVTYDANNGSEGENVTYSDPGQYTGTDTVSIMDEAGLLPFMGSISKAGYDFAGWNTEPDGTGTDYAPGQETSLTESLYLYAKWVAKAPVIITFVYNDGNTGTDSTKAVPDSEFTFPEASRKGHILKGWYEDEGLIIFAGNGGETHTVPQEDTSYYAAWEKTEATVTFDADGGKMDGGEVTAKIGDTIKLPGCMKEGYEFTGWYDGDTCIGQAGEEYTVFDDVALKAHYEEETADICGVTFDVDGGKMEGGNITAKVGDTITLPACIKEGYKFSGWYDGDTVIGKAGEEYTVSADVILKVRYDKEEGEEVICTVTFDADGGETVRKSLKAEKGSAVILPLCSKSGHEFLGWFLASDDSICIGQAGEEFTVQGDISLKAHFEQKEAVEVTITFDADGGKAVNPIKAEKGDMTRLPKTEKDGYSFLGWYTEKEGGILLGIPGSEMKAVRDMTAYVLWEKEAAEDDDKNDADSETCKVVFHAGKGTVKVKELTIIKDGSLYLPMPEREGYDFIGWYLDDGLTQSAGAYHDTYRVTKDTDFYAKWEKEKDNGSNGDSGNSGNTGDNGGNGGNGDNAQENNSGENLNTYTIKYDANGGKTKNASVKVVKGGSVKLPAAEREGYNFKGWYTDRQVFIGTEGEAYKPGRSISLYARWEKAEKDNKDGPDNNNTGNTNDKDNKSITDKNKDTSGTVSGNSAGSPSDKNKDTNTATKTEGENGNDGKGTEPVIQTGYASPFALPAALGLCGVLLAGVSVLEGKKGKKCSL